MIEALESPELQYTGLIFVLFVLPRFLVRLGIPLAVSALAMGIAASHFGLAVSTNEVVRMLSSLGIVSLFLFAGLEVEFSELQRSKSVLFQHVAVSFGVLMCASLGIMRWFELDVRSSILIGLAILTPSAGFILDTIDAAKVPEESKFWIRSKAIAAEIVALILMFIMVRSMSLSQLAFSSLGLAALILALPLAFRFFANAVAPVAPRSEFGFLLMIALLAGMITKKLGAYYLIGAFIVGIVARRFEASIPSLTSRSMLRSLKFFTNFFIPFYFFHAGSFISAAELTGRAFLIGAALILIFLPIRIGTIVWHRKISLSEASVQSFPIATSLLPNLVFGLVLSDLLTERFHVSAHIVGGVIVYTIGITLLPPLLIKFFGKAPPEYSSLVEAESNFGDHLF